MTQPLEDLLEGKYEILDKIAEGGIGSIYKVRHKLLEEIRVIKVLRSQVADREDLHKRLLQEAKTAIRLEHPSIARLFDLTVADDGTAYLVMEFIDGVSLDSLLAANGPPSVELTLEVAKQALAALGYLHECGFIHRDISPDNLMITRDFSDRLHVKLIDLGIAKNLAQETGVTAVGTFLGKVKYCAPELFKDAGVKLLDQRSDNYSLAVTLYELLTGRHPFTGETFEELAAGHLFHPPLSFDLTDPDGRVPQPLRDVIFRALEKDPDDRPASAAEFAATLEQFPIDERDLAAEFERTVGATTRFLSKFETYSAGSTQDHLNRQFGMTKTGAAGQPAEEADDEAAKPTAVDHTKAVPAGTPDRAPRAVANRGRALRWLGLAALPLVAAGAWWVLRPTPSTPESEPSATATPITVAERFDPNAADSIVNVPAVPSGPLDDEPAGDARSQSAAPPTRSSPTRPHEAVTRAEPAPVAAEPTVENPEPAALDADAPIALLEPGPGVTPPKLLAPIRPPYPRPDRREVVVVLSAYVSHEGQVLTATIKEAPSFRRRYREAAIAAVQRAAFEPATKDGVPGRMWVDVEVVFEP